MRICLDPKDLNEALEREPYYTWSIQEILGKFHSMTQFMIVDFNKGYWVVELHPDSRKLMTMALDIGRFQCTWLPIGSIIAQVVFQRKLNSIFLDIPGVTGIADDMIIYGRDDQEHNGNLLDFLEVCRNNNLTLNTEKMQFRHGNNEKFPGINQLSQWFSPHLAELSDLLREICRQKMEFKLTPACKVAFQRIKEEISKNVTLPYFNPYFHHFTNWCIQKRTQWCLHPEPWLEVRETIKTLNESV